MDTERDVIMDMKQEFRTLKRYYQENDFEKIFNHTIGLYFLKIRSLSRSTILRELGRRLKIDTSGVSGRDLFEFMFCKNIATEEIDAFIKQIILSTIKNPKELIKWFYEEQGIRRFDAANRFFLVLIDLKNLEDSWKLKRNKKLLHETINEFLDNNNGMDFETMKLSFNWQDRTYTTYATTLFILKE